MRAIEIEYSGPEVKTKTPYAFDLGRELELIQRHGNSYRDFFGAQVDFYLAESYGRVPKTEYKHDIRRDGQGNVNLFFGPMKQKALDSYREPLSDNSLPLWYRKRAMGDVRWVQNLEKNLSGLSEGEMLVDLSPTEFDVSHDERKKWGFGWHSFVRIHEIVKDEQGKEHLKSRALRNYLDLPEQIKLYQMLTGQKAEGDLLGQVGKLKPGMGLGHIEKIINDLDQNTPRDRKITPPQNDLVYADKEEMRQVFGKIRPWTDRIFHLMRKGFSEYQIEKEFKGMEMLVKGYLNGEKIDFDFFDKLNPEQILWVLPASGDPIHHYMAKPYEPGQNGCGSGSGFGKREVSGKMDYESMTANERNFSFDEAGPCRLCGEDVLCGPCKICKGCNDKIDSGELTVGE